MPPASQSESSARTAEPAAGRTPASATLVVGLGNPLRGDDGVGLKVAEGLRQAAAMLPDVEIAELSVGGLALMERLLGYERVIIIDAASTGAGQPGTIRISTLGDLGLKSTANLDSSHDATLLAAMGAARSLGVEVPSKILIVAVEVTPTDAFATGLTPAVAAAIPAAIAVVLELLAS